MPTIRMSSRAVRIKPAFPSAITFLNMADKDSEEAAMPCSPRCSTKRRAHSQQSLSVADVMENGGLAAALIHTGGDQGDGTTIADSQLRLRLLRQNRQANYGQRHKCERPVIRRAKSPHLGRVDALGSADQYQQAPESPSLT